MFFLFLLFMLLITVTGSTIATASRNEKGPRDIQVDASLGPKKKVFFFSSRVFHLFSY
jgi:hypothetical protein